MVTQQGSCVEAFAAEESVIDAAATVWAVVMSATDLPDTPEGRDRLARARARANELLADIGLQEEQLRQHLVRRHTRCRRGDPSPDPARRATLRLLRDDRD